jgi:ribosomal protein L40E
MEKQTFQGYNCDLAQLQKSIATYFIGKCYRVTNFYKEKMYVTQAYKNQMGSRTIICQIQGVPENFDISIGLGTKITNINTLQPLEKIPLDIKVLLGEPLLERNFLNYIFTQTELKRNTFGLVKTDNPSLAPVWKEREIVREIEVIYCRYCGTKNNARQTNCSKCNATLH